MAATLVYQVPGDDWGIYLVGAWKRTLECREFGRGYEHQRTSNSVVVVEQAEGVAAEPGTYVSGCGGLWMWGCTCLASSSSIGWFGGNHRSIDSAPLSSCHVSTG
jgi:hypothetical protein